MDEWEALWTQQRDAVVQKIKSNKWGKSADGKTVTGADGFAIDLSKCPAGWSETQGLSDSEIKIGQTLPQSGPAADYGNVGKAMTMMFDHYNNKGVFKDSQGKTRKVNLLIKDDGYDPARTIPLTDELIDSEKVFAMSTLGSANAMKTYDKLNQRCVPQPIIQSGHPAWGDPVNHPWSTGQQLAYNTEAVLWGAFIDQHMSEIAGSNGKVTVASLVSNNDFGKAYDVGFKAYIAQSPNKDKINYVSETIEPTAPTVTDPMTTLASKNPQVFIAMVFASYCTQAITNAAQNGLADKAKYLFQPSVCPGTTYAKKEAVGSEGTASIGWWQVNAGSKDINDPSQFSDPFIAWARDQLNAKGIDPKSSSTLGSGIYFAWSWVQALQIAGQLEGGLTRSNLILTVRSMNMTHPIHLPGIQFNMSGNKDAYFGEGGVFQSWDVAKQAWVVQGNVIDLSGKSKNCAWDQSAGICR
ncbi:MAG: branched-chain amino acid transport system substrate-binding protein [Acidimicrobiia bacterium]|nr:branched-chain amino acid transport system substrate-binding protein [Acidimicrobiia bacterium]